MNLSIAAKTKKVAGFLFLCKIGRYKKMGTILFGKSRAEPGCVPISLCNDAGTVLTPARLGHEK